jgi:hypothetical protein
MVVDGMLPFSLVELGAFRLCFNLCKPDVALPSAKTLKGDLMKCYRQEDGRVNERLRNASGKISVTFDCWTSPNNEAYLGVTGHYIDNDWAMQSLLLDFVPLPGEHTGENLCGAFVDVCVRRGILDKLLGVTTDNAANMGKCLADLEGACRARGVTFDKDQQRVRCVAHVVDLAVQAFLRELKAEDSTADSDPDCGVATQTADESCIAKLRCIVRWIRSSPQRSQCFRSLCEECPAPEEEGEKRRASKKGAILDSPTRWNSTYAMIQRALELRGPLSQLRKVAKGVPELSSEEWVLLDVAGQLLGLFEEGSRWLCAANYPTLNRAVCVYNHLLDELENFLGRCNEEEEGRQRAAIVDQCSPTNKRALMTAMKAAYDKLCYYYSDTWAGSYAVSLILDPSTHTPGLASM